MAGQWPKLVRDPIHNLIRFDDNPVDHLLLKLIDSREFQRLRRIKQLGFSDTVFPGATHTRFAHSIGVMWNAKRLLRRLHQLDHHYVPEEHRLVVLVAALLHDLGHGPFSHAFEKVTRTKHERRTVEIILDSTTEVHDALAKHHTALPNRVASLFDEGLDLIDESALDGYQCPKHLRDVVSSQLDGDRWDYLIRDSHYSGTEYGRFDVDWLLDHLFVDPDRRGGALCLTRKAHHAVEGYVFARYHMYQSVYFHKATRASEVMLRLLFERYKELLAEKDSESKRKRVVREAPLVVMRAFSGDVSLADYLLLDDHSVTQFLKAAISAGDKTLAYLASGLLNRRLYKAVDATDVSRTEPGKIGTFVTAVKSRLEEIEHPVSEDSMFESDEPSDTPYRIYDPDSAYPATQIYVQRATGEIVELSRTSDLVDALRKKVTLLRYYFPPELQSVIDPIAEEHLRRRSA